MQWTGLNELREKFLEFFESKGHLRLPSFSLIPQDDNSLLLINSGMAPMKNYFTGRSHSAQQACDHLPEVHPHRRTLRTWARPPATAPILRCWATSPSAIISSMRPLPGPGNSSPRCWRCPKDRLYVSIYENDDEAYDIWTKEIGVDPEPHGPPGQGGQLLGASAPAPAAPARKSILTAGEKYGCGKPDLRRGLRLRPVCGILEPGVLPV